MAIKVTIDDNFNNPKVRVLMLKGEKGDLNYNDIVDNLNSTLSNKVLSAKQGKILKDLSDKKPYYFNNVASMKSASLVAGDYVITEGYYSSNDGGGAIYYITTTQSDSDYQETLNNGSYATLITNNIFNVKQFGATGLGNASDLSYINNAISFIKAGQILYFPEGTYLIDNVITINKSIIVTGKGTINLGGAGFNAITISANNVTVDGLTFTNTENYTPTTLSSGNIGDAIRVNANECIIKNCNITNYIAGIVFGYVGGDLDKCIIENNNIKIKGLNTGFINDGICSLGDNAIIKNNFVTNYDNVNNRGCIVCDINALNNIVESNICLCNGYCAVGVHSEASANTIIKSNNIYNPRLLGATISTGSIVTNNYIETPHTEVSGYTLDHCAISLYGAPKNCVIDGNLINCFLDTKMAIRGNGNTSGTKIVNNSIYSTDNHTPTTAILMHLAEDTIIANNTIKCQCGTGISVNHPNNTICNNIIFDATTYGINLSESQSCNVSNNKIYKAPIGIEVYNATNSNVSNNVIGNTTDTNATGIRCRNTGSHKLVICNNNMFINVTTPYDRSTYGGLALVQDKDEIDLIDTTLTTRKKLTIDNGSINIS